MKGSRLPIQRQAWIAASALFLTSQLQAQQFKDLTLIEDVLTCRTEVIALDYDLDGDLDVATCGLGTPYVSLHVNLASGTFAQGVEISNLDNCWAIEAGDLNNDGLPDIFAAGEDAAWTLINLGAGVWQQTTGVALSGASRGCCLHDLDNDGDLDALVAVYYGNTFVWLANDGTGNLGTPMEVWVGGGNGPQAIKAGDFNNDGLPDLLTGTRADAPRAGIHFGAAQAAFAPPADLGPNGEYSNPDSVAIADVNGDGLLDILVSDSATARVDYHENTGMGSFAAPMTIATGYSFYNVEALDVDNDQIVDVVVSSIQGSTWLVKGVGNGMFEPQAQLPGSSGWTEGLVCADVSGNGSPDVLVVDCSANVGRLSWYESLVPPDCDGDGVSNADELASGSLDCNSNEIPDTCDIDGDPSLDLDGNGILDSCEVSDVIWARSPVSGRFYTSLPPMEWAEAEAIAVSYSGHLATIRSQDENDWVASLYGHDQAWIGLNDVSLEGSFEWTGGDGTGYTNWAPGSPGGFAADQDYVAISGLDGQWNDWFAANLYPGIVEVEGADCDNDTRPDAFQIATGPDNDWNGDGVLDVCVAPNYCEGAPNSADPDGGVMTISGSPLIGDNDVELRATGLPGSQWSFFIMSRTQANVPGFGGSQGTLCLGAPQYRFNRSSLGEIAQTTPLGVRSLALDLTNLPQGVVMLPGETWNFQLWFRDVNPSLTSNTTDGISVMFR